VNPLWDTHTHEHTRCLRAHPLSQQEERLLRLLLLHPQLPAKSPRWTSTQSCWAVYRKSSAALASVCLCCFRMFVLFPCVCVVSVCLCYFSCVCVVSVCLCCFSCVCVVSVCLCCFLVFVPFPCVCVVSVRLCCSRMLVSRTLRDLDLLHCRKN